MKTYVRILYTLMTISIVASAQNGATRDQCFVCHDGIGDARAEMYKRDVHYTKGISCAACHGGNAKKEEMEEAMSKSAGYIGVPKGDAISERCASCHSDATAMKKYGSSLPTNQHALLTTSIHGKSALSGKEHIAQCTTCHGSHRITSVNDPSSPVHPLNAPATCAKCHENATYMRSYNVALPVDQLSKYRTSVHGMLNKRGDAKAAECTSCHGGHDIHPSSDVRSKVYPLQVPKTCAKCHSDSEYMKAYKIPTTQFDDYARSVHGVALLKKGDVNSPACNDCHGNHGASPPGIESISKVCGTCHVLNAELFSASPHKKPFDEQNLPECETCHGNHKILAATNQLLGVDKDAVCSECHTESKNKKGYKVAGLMRMLIDSLERVEERAKGFIHDAEQKGMEISEAKFKLREVRQARLTARTTVHTFSEEKFAEVLNPGLKTALTVHDEAASAVDEFFYRRWGLGIATFVISLLAVALYVYIRRLNHRSIADTSTQ